MLLFTVNILYWVGLATCGQIRLNTWYRLRISDHLLWLARKISAIFKCRPVIQVRNLNTVPCIRSMHDLTVTYVDSHMPDISVWTVEYKISRLKLACRDLCAHGCLWPWRMRKLHAELSIYLHGKARAVKTAGRHGSVAVRSATETICVIDNLVDEIVAAVLLQLFQNGALLAITQLLGLCSEAWKGNCKDYK